MKIVLYVAAWIFLGMSRVLIMLAVRLPLERFTRIFWLFGLYPGVLVSRNTCVSWMARRLAHAYPDAFFGLLAPFVGVQTFPSKAAEHDEFGMMRSSFGRLTPGGSSFILYRDIVE